MGKDVSKARRVAAFVSIGASSVVPLIHYISTFGLATFTTAASFPYYVIGSASNLIGAALYALKFPERIIPGKCDILFHSHQFLHVCVTIAAYHYLGGFIEMSKAKMAARSGL